MRKVLISLLLLFLLLNSTVWGMDKNKVDPVLQLVYSRRNEPTKLSNLQSITNFYSANGKDFYYVSLLMRINPNSNVIEELKQMEVKVHTQVNDIITAHVPINLLSDISYLDNVYRIQASGKCQMKLDASVPETNAPSVWSGLDLPQSYTGDGVIVGVIDTGIDLLHEDFKFDNGDTRIIGLWDQTVGDGVGGPPYGTYWTQEQINNGECTEIDDGGHGTHCAGIAAGNARASTGTYKGIAYDADLFIVKTDFDDTHLIDAADAIFGFADELGKPAVINMSLGGHSGSHDDNDLVTSALNSLVESGKIIVAAAGNEGGKILHLGYDVFDTAKYTSFSVNEEQNMMKLDLWYQNTGNIEVMLALWNSSDEYSDTTPWVAPGDTISGIINMNSTGGTAKIIINATQTDVNGLANISILIEKIDVPLSQVLWYINTKGNGYFDAWIASDNGAFSTETDGDHIGGDSYYTIGMPGVGSNMITVGSYVTKTQWIDQYGTTQYQSGATIYDISGFSSLGPTRDGRSKPDITAPGEIIASAKSTDYSADAIRILQNTNYTMMEGTSMATPHVCGAIALMLEANSDLTPEQIKTKLQANAIIDEHTGNPPNPNVWGAGKMNIWHTMYDITSVDDNLVNNENLPNSYYLNQNFPNPFNPITEITFAIPVREMVKLSIYNTSGQLVNTLVNSELDAGYHKVIWKGNDMQNNQVSSGIYFYKLQANEYQETKKMIMLK